MKLLPERELCPKSFSRKVWLFLLFGMLLVSMRAQSRFNSSNKEKKRPCRVAVTNSRVYHYETLESIAALLPNQYLSLSDRNCDETFLKIDYHVYASYKLGVSWADYFEKFMRGKEYLQEYTLSGADQAKTIQQRRLMGNLTRYYYPRYSSTKILVPAGYDVTVEASCYCGLTTWLQEDYHRTCIFHEQCPSLSNHSTAIWVSPHHSQYSIPVVLPKMPLPLPRLSSSGGNKLPTLCVVGESRRRNWDMLQYFLDKATGMKSLDTSIEKLSEPPFQLQILGKGGYPPELNRYRHMTNQSHPKGFLEFHERVAQDCHGMLFLLSRKKCPSYFEGGKLTGSIPLVIAYEKPVVMHKKLYKLYHKHLPPGLLVETHSDENESFAFALNAFLQKLAQGSSQQQKGV